MRGQDILFNKHLEPLKIAPSDNKERRNMVLSARYYYHMHYQRLRFDDIIYQLSNEFFLSEKRIVDILTDLRDVIDTFMKSKPELKELRKEYGWYNWD